MRVGVVGINHKQAKLQLREMLAKTCQRRFDSKHALHPRHHFVLLSTCNRTEIYFSSEDLAATHSYILNILKREVCEDFEQRLYSFFSIDCLHHLSRVTSGLDSAIFWETEIQGQVKAAYEHSTHYSQLPKELHYLFQKALKNGKLVRSSYDVGRGMPDIEHALIHLASEQLELESARILFVGASAINLKILSFLNSKKLPHLTLTNRTNEKAEAAAEKLSVSFLPWEQKQHWTNYDWIIFGTKSPQTLVDEKTFSETFATRLLTDLCVPRNVDPRLEEDKRLVVHNIDSIHRTLKVRRQKVAHFATLAEGLLEEAVLRQAYRFQTKTAPATFALCN